MKPLLLFILFVLFWSVSNGQDSLDHRISFGIRGGVGYASITNPGKFSGRYNYKQHVQLGVYTEVRIAKPVYLQVELLFSNPGMRLFQIDNKGNKTRDSIFSFNCIQMPIQAKFKTSGEQVKGYYMIGVAPSFLINAMLKYKMDSTNTFFNYTPYENRFTLNLVNTIGVEVDINELVIPFIDFRYMLGLTNVHRLRGIEPVTNLQLILSVGVRF